MSQARGGGEMEWGNVICPLYSGRAIIHKSQLHFFRVYLRSNRQPQLNYSHPAFLQEAGRKGSARLTITAQHQFFQQQGAPILSQSITERLEIESRMNHGWSVTNHPCSLLRSRRQSSHQENATHLLLWAFQISGLSILDWWWRHLECFFFLLLLFFLLIAAHLISNDSNSHCSPAHTS